jgi:hypothetical protein
MYLTEWYSYMLSESLAEILLITIRTLWIYSQRCIMTTEIPLRFSTAARIWWILWKHIDGSINGRVIHVTWLKVFDATTVIPLLVCMHVCWFVCSIELILNIDNQRQEAINLFLGNYVFEKGQPMLWDLSTDYYLHHGVPTGKKPPRRSYRRWWTSIHLQQPLTQREIESLEKEIIMSDSIANPRLTSGYFDNYWMEYYKPKLLSSFSKVFQYNMNSTLRYLPSM